MPSIRPIYNGVNIIIQSIVDKHMFADTPNMHSKIIYIKISLKRRIPLLQIITLINSVDLIEIVFKFVKLNKIKWNLTIIKKHHFIHCIMDTF